MVGALHGGHGGHGGTLRGVDTAWWMHCIEDMLGMLENCMVGARSGACAFVSAFPALEVVGSCFVAKRSTA
eukprot:scaffold324735_cov52-Tisochrysis_lutea.AAC.1